MNTTLKRIVLPCVIAINLVGVTLIPSEHAAANDELLKDIGIGAATGAVGGIITGDDVLEDAVKGAAAGATVNEVNRRRANRCQSRKLERDILAGAGGSTVAGIITNRRRDVVGNAAKGAAVGTIIHATRKNCR
ncbi:hypothetical protein [Mastigocoleus sp. MO_188.B34]|uniref:hypothetical protein n=1 Tax=Mastigocoleus sp. MO_188.B34 TaxID=3036635 RepID=UPI0026084C7B|nr:hypothetical protein [Mastigocoleus sp. MO_188.B34]MDJ0696277.1 hypothetical protein [Mastigocoleus sp. MO_188.B34]